MRDAAERITMRHLRTRTTAGIACAVLTLTAANCSSDAGGDSSDTKSTSSSTSSATTSQAGYDDEHAYAEAEKAIRAVDKHDGNEPIPKDAAWASENYRKAYNEQITDDEDMGVTEKGKVTTTGIEPAESNPDAPGGWDLTMYACSTSTVRLYDKDGKDVTGDDEGNPLPDKPQKGVHLVSLTTPDDGKTWRVDNVQALSGDDAKEASCAA